MRFYVSLYAAISFLRYHPKSCRLETKQNWVDELLQDNLSILKFIKTSKKMLNAAIK